ncbi:MAG: HAMP domain-containing sensor histidine kinase, partial [Bacteroidota bacterium]
QTDLYFERIVEEVRDSVLFAELDQFIVKATPETRQKKTKELGFMTPSSSNLSKKVISTFSITTDESFPQSNEKDTTFKINRIGVSLDPKVKRIHDKITLKAITMAMEKDGQETVSISLGRSPLPLDVLKVALEDSMSIAETPMNVFVSKTFSYDSLSQKRSILSIIDNNSSNDKGIIKTPFYYAQIENTTMFLWQQIIPQLFFSLFLFSITTVSFLFIFRNWKQQQRLTQLKNDFISNITHELKTPITTVGVALEAISNFDVIKDPVRTDEYLGIARGELKRLNLLVDRVLQLSKFERNTPTLKLETIHLDELIEQILASMKLQFEKKRAHIYYKNFSPSPVIEGDLTHLSSVIYNLIDNALKYSSHNPSIEIIIDETPDGQLVFSVQDNGLGIPKSYQNKVFDKFFRVPSGDRHNTKGHGLGLNYVAGIVKLHQGHIFLDSEVNQGSTFTIHLPKTQSHYV